MPSARVAASMARVFGNLRWRRRCGASDAMRAVYKAQLCAGCHAMREFSGRTTSLLANYDQSLLVLVLSAIGGEPVAAAPCTALPWRTIDLQRLPKAQRTFVAAGNLALIDAKLRDDVDDGRRWWTRPLRWLLRRKVRRAFAALRAQGFAVELLESLPPRQAAVEAAAQPSLQQLAAPSAELLGEIFAHGGSLGGSLDGREEATPELRRFGRAVGAAVYAFDALEDHDDDRARGRFNAVAKLAARVGHAAGVHATQRFAEHELVAAQQAATLLLPEDRRAIVASILQQLAQQVGRHADHLLGRPEAAAMRPAEAGDCDCACDCDACNCASGDGCDGCACDCCCDACCFGRRGRKRRVDQARDEANELPVR